MHHQVGSPKRIWSHFTLFMACMVLGVSTTGCTKLLTATVLLFKGTDTPAEFKELKEKNVAVAVVTPSGILADRSAVTLAQQVHLLLGQNVKKIKLVSMEEVTQVAREQPSGSDDIVKLGKDLDVDYIVAVQLDDMQLYQGKTLYQGRCHYSVSVFEPKASASAVFHRDVPQFIYPQNGGHPVTDMPESRFESTYLGIIAIRIARYFHPFDATRDVGLDGMLASVGNS